MVHGRDELGWEGWEGGYHICQGLPSNVFVVLVVLVYTITSTYYINQQSLVLRTFGVQVATRYLGFVVYATGSCNILRICVVQLRYLKAILAVSRGHITDGDRQE